jgi:hypothetical protein
LKGARGGNHANADALDIIDLDPVEEHNGEERDQL